LPDFNSILSATNQTHLSARVSMHRVRLRIVRKFVGCWPGQVFWNRSQADQLHLSVGADP